MKLALISSLALATSMFVSGAAMAETVINGVTIPEQEVAYVQGHCDTLERLDSTGNSASASPTGVDMVEAPAGDAALVSSIDLDTLTLEECKTAGLV
jgi:hypothetical protein